jgi:hypothetical protein
MKGIIIFFIIFIFTLFEVYSQEKNQTEQLLGVNLGSTTGVGIAYRAWGMKSGAQLVFLPLIDKEKTHISAAATYLHLLSKKEESRFFIYAGTHFTNFFADEYTFHVGVGPGYEYLKDDISMSIMAGFGAYNITTDNSMTRPSIEFTLAYRFK